MSIFDKYTERVSAEELAKAQQELEQNGNTEYDEVPVGRYEVKVKKMEAKLSKSGNPMVSIWFEIVKGNYKGQLIFYNGTYHEDWMRHRVVDFLSNLLDDGTHKAEINLILKDYDVHEVNEFIMDVHEQIESKFEYLLDYGMKKGYNTYTIEEWYELD